MVHSSPRRFCGGREIDVLRLFLVPVLLREGISLFAGEYDRQRLRLLETESHDTGIVEHRYEVLE
ncbi:hypothetical protein [Natronosalvus vescus]|uniref:hypothetical protein n=1 Tax=Natronosalvus vescus TaxID=2953881 RepID=UPI0020904571|nr:hypothetical protein [Natronosalvus vescus]